MISITDIGSLMVPCELFFSMRSIFLMDKFYLVKVGESQIDLLRGLYSSRN